MQDGSVPIERRKHGPDAWSFRWREAGPAGRRVHRRIVLGSAEELKSLASARKMVVGLRREINVHDVRIRKESITLNDLSRHYQQRELVDRNQRISCAAATTRSDEYKSPEDWLFASPVHQGRWPYLAQQIMRHHILPVARKLSINKRIGWHTFRHTYSTLLRSTGAELEIMQELLRHSTIRATLDTYTQAVTTEGRSAQEAVVARLCPRKTPE
jgi:site-specific recombinase XerD